MNYATSTLLACSAIALTASITPSTGFAADSVSDTPFGAFSDGSITGWKTRSFEGNSEYELVEDQGVPVLKGHANKQASVFYTEQDIFMDKTPVINWSWKIDDIYRNIDEQTRAGDDFPARLYVVVKTGMLPWETLAINYVWAAQVPVGEAWVNPFTDKAYMVSVNSGEDDVGKWVSHSRNVYKDFQTYFNVDVENLSGYAVMVDGDNAGKDGTGWFGNISFTETPASN